MKNIKKISIAAVVLAICAVLGITAWAAGTSGVSYNASFDNSSVCVNQKETVTLTVELDSAIPVFMVSAKIDLPQGFTVVSVENSTLGFETAGDHEFAMDSNTNIFTWFVSTAENKSTKLLAKIVVKLPENQAAGTYKMGLSNIYLASFENNGIKFYAENESISGAQLQIKNHSYTAKSEKLASAATCLSPAHYYAACAGCGVVNELAPTIETGTALGHAWNEATYVWAADGKSCTATRTCANNTTGACVESETAYFNGVDQQYVSAEVTTKATCLNMGWTTYTATFKDKWADEGVNKITKTVQDVAIDFDWHDENAVSTETYTDLGNGQHIYNITCECGGLVFEETVPHDFTEGDCKCGACEHRNKKYEKNSGTATHNLVCQKCYEVLEENIPCSGGEANCVAGAVCDDCETVYTSIDMDNHYSDAFTYVDITDAKHAVKHTCCGIVDKAVAHDFTEGDCDCGAVALTVKGFGVDEYDSDLDEGYSVSGRVVTVKYSLACKVGYLEDDIYVAIDAEKNNDGSYSFTVPTGVTEVIVVVKGDANGNGEIDYQDATMTKSVYLELEDKDGNVYEFSAEQSFATDVNNNDEVDYQDVTMMKTVYLEIDDRVFEW